MSRSRVSSSASPTTAKTDPCARLRDEAAWRGEPGPKAPKSTVGSAVARLRRNGPTGTTGESCATPVSMNSTANPPRDRCRAIEPARARATSKESFSGESRWRNTRSEAYPPRRVSRMIRASAWLRGSSWRTISSPCLAVARQCTRRIASPVRYSRVERSSSPPIARRTSFDAPSEARIASPVSGSSRIAGVTTSGSVSPTRTSPTASPKGSASTTPSGPMGKTPRRGARSSWTTTVRFAGAIARPRRAASGGRSRIVDGAPVQGPASRHSSSGVASGAVFTTVSATRTDPPTAMMSGLNSRETSSPRRRNLANATASMGRSTASAPTYRSSGRDTT